jgi:hypothetical protein
MGNTKFSYAEYNGNYPCEECSAPCCKYLIIPYNTPTTWMDMDFIKYLLNFPKVNLTVSKKGIWSIMIKQNCVHLDEKNTKCMVHKTPEQPKTCEYYNPFQCHYKMNLNSKQASSIYVLNRDNFQYWLQDVKFDENGMIVDGPDFEKSLKILKENKR